MVRLFLLVIATLAPGIAFADAPCRTVDFERVDSADQVAAMQDVCEVTGGIGIFTEGIAEISFPRLQTAKLINIEAYGLKAVNFPTLKTAESLYIRGPELIVAEFPALQSVSSTLWIQSRQISIINFPNLGRVTFLGIQGNPSLQFVFADKLFDVRESSITNNAVLNPGSSAMLTGVTQVLTPGEIEFISNAKEQVRIMKQRLIDQELYEEPMPPTGHDTYFGTDTQGTYYRWYPYYLWNYWNNLGPWGYQRYYNFVW